MLNNDGNSYVTLTKELIATNVLDEQVWPIIAPMFLRIKPSDYCIELTSNDMLHEPLVELLYILHV